MCTELILACLYFFTIFVVNYFLFRLISLSLKNASYLGKITQLGKFIQTFSSFSDSRTNFKKNLSFETNVSSWIFLSYFFILLRKDSKKVIFSSSLPKLRKTQDLLILGNTYHSLLNYTQANSQEKNSSLSEPLLNTYYFRLLENQYLG